MSSNSKLSQEQKQDLKQLKADFVKAGGVLASVDGVTVALMRTGECQGKFSVSIASPDEIKNRRKVGEFYALDRFYFGECIPARLRSKREMSALGFGEENYMASRAQGIARAVCS